MLISHINKLMPY